MFKVGEFRLQLLHALLLLVRERLELRGLALLEGGGQRADVLAGGGELIEDGDDLGVGAGHGPDGVVAVDVVECGLGIDLRVLLSAGRWAMEFGARELGGEETELGRLDFADEVAESGVEDGARKRAWGWRARRGGVYRLSVRGEAVKGQHCKSD